MEVKNYMLILFLILNFSCNVQKHLFEIGNVYVSTNLDKMKRNDTENYFKELQSIYPILAIRVDNQKGNTLEIKYRFGHEGLMDIDFVYDEQKKYYISEDKILFTPFGEKRGIGNIKFLKRNKVILQIEGDSNQYEFILSYKDEIDYQIYRDPYYSEDGYELFRN